MSTAGARVGNVATPAPLLFIGPFPYGYIIFVPKNTQNTHTHRKKNNNKKQKKKTKKTKKKKKTSTWKTDKAM